MFIESKRDDGGFGKGIINGKGESKNPFFLISPFLIMIVVNEGTVYLRHSNKGKGFLTKIKSAMAAAMFAILKAFLCQTDSGLKCASATKS